MKNIMDLLVTKKYSLIVDENEVTKTLKVINSHHRFVPEMQVGSYDWPGENKWFIHFTTSRAKWKLVRSELKVQRIFEYADIPKDKKGIVYSTD